MISKEFFIQCINDVKECEEYAVKLNDFFRKNKVEGYIFQPDCSATVVRLLHEIFGKADANDDISYFCYELDFGKRWQKGMIKDTVNGKQVDIDMSSAEKLYDYLVANTQQEME